MAETYMPTFNQPQGIPTQAQQPTYPTPAGISQGGGTGGLVDKNKIINDGVQNAINQTQQLTQMRRDTQAYNEKQAANKGMANAANLDAPANASATGDGHSDFMSSVLQGLHSLGTGIENIFGGGSKSAIPAPSDANSVPAGTQQGPPAPAQPNSAPAAAAPAPAAASPATGAPAPMQDGGPVTDSHGNEIKKSTVGDLASQAVKEVSSAMFGSGGAARAADAAKTSASPGHVDGAVEGYENGGPITPEFIRGQPNQPSVLAFQQGGAIPAGPAMGVVQGATNGIPGFQTGGEIPNSSAIVAAGSQNAIDQSQQLAQGARTGTQYGQDQGARAAKADASMPPQVAQAHLVTEIDQLHQDMHDHSLNDDDQPHNSQAIPAGAPPPSGAASAPNAPGPQSAAVSGGPQGGPPPAQGAPPAPQGAPAQASASQAAPPPGPGAQATAQVVKDVATDPTAQTGQITTTPSDEGKPHSITMDKWNDWDDRINNAVKLAAIAGQDPGQVRAALEANRNAFVQGHVLRYLSAANVNLLNGNQKGVEQALKNAYYYMPDGQDLTIQKGKDGTLMYQDPVNPTEKGPDGKVVPRMIPVDSAHIQLLGQAMLDPMNVQRTIQEVRSAQAVVQLKAAQSQAALMTGQGNLNKGTGILEEGQSHLARVNSQNYKDLAEGDAARIRAVAIQNKLANTVKSDRLDPNLLKGANDAGTQFEQAVQGQLTTIPGANNPNSTNPNAGKATRDPTKSTLPKATPEDIAQGKALSGQIFLGGRGSVPPAEAARLATLAMVAKRSSSPKPDDKGKISTSPDFMTDPKTGDTHVWNKAMRKWEAFRLPLTSAIDAASGNLGITADDLDDTTKAELASNGGTGGGQSAIPTSSPNMQGARSEGDMQDQTMADDT